jgi:hypothetical protein
MSAKSGDAASAAVARTPVSDMLVGDVQTKAETDIEPEACIRGSTARRFCFGESARLHRIANVRFLTEAREFDAERLLWGYFCRLGATGGKSALPEMLWIL